MSKTYIKQQLMSTDQTKVIYPQTKAEIVWREDLSETVESSLRKIENLLGDTDNGDIDTEINESIYELSPGYNLGTINLLKDQQIISSSYLKGFSDYTWNLGFDEMDPGMGCKGISLEGDPFYLDENYGVSMPLTLTGEDCHYLGILFDFKDMICPLMATPDGLLYNFSEVITSSDIGSGLNYTNGSINHSNTITAGIAGSSTAQTLTYGGSFTIPYINYDTNGHITSVGNRTITMPNASSSSDINVKQNAAITTNGNYPIILANSTGTTEVTGSVNKSSTLTYNPSTKQLYINSGTGSTSTSSGALRVSGGIGCSENIYASKVYGAVWNDYAEYRKTDELKPGLCVCEDGDGKLSLSKERLQPGANIISDTFGFAIGETDECKTPIAVSGRVLVYPYENKEEYQPGDAVCAGPDGTISKMTREEIREYPERIVGTVSEIPTYETWGTNNVKVNGRIWIKVR